MEIRVGVCRFSRKRVGVRFFPEKWIRVCCYCRNKGRSVSFLSKNGWECFFFFFKMGASGRE